MFNPRPVIRALPIDAQHACYVVDDVLLEPERWIDYALQHRGDFRITDHNAFPGPELRMPDEISAHLDLFFAQHIRSLLGARRTVRMYSRLSMVTLPPKSLKGPQWVCHRDRFDVPPEECVGASVLYLFRDERLGGTNFFRPTRSAFETDVLVHESGALLPESFTKKYGIERGYMTESNAWFERTLSVPPRFNRAIFYDGSLFHCGHIQAPERLSDDPRSGRLTLNGFFTCTRRVA